MALLRNSFVNEEGEDDERELGRTVNAVFAHSGEEFADETRHLELTGIETAEAIDNLGDVLIEGLDVQVGGESATSFRRTPGRMTFSATTRPSSVRVALCTCATVALATGFSLTDFSFPAIPFLASAIGTVPSGDGATLSCNSQSDVRT